MSDRTEFRAARLQRERFRALEAERRVEMLRGRLVARADLENAARQAYTVARDVLRAWVAETIRAESSLTDLDAVDAYLTRTGRDVLTTISTRLEAARPARGDA